MGKKRSRKGRLISRKEEKVHIGKIRPKRPEEGNNAAVQHIKRIPLPRREKEVCWETMYEQKAFFYTRGKVTKERSRFK